MKLVSKIRLVEGGTATVPSGQHKKLRRWKWHKCGFCEHIFRTIRIGGRYEIIYLAAQLYGNPELHVKGGCNPCPAVPDLNGKEKR